jgi:hypothetical protein
MEKSENIAELTKALSKFQSEVNNVKKDATNPFFKSKYASLENVWDAVRDPLTKNGLALSQFPSGENELTSVLMHSSGQFLAMSIKMMVKEQTPQGLGSAITYMRRYAMGAILGIATEEDDDGNHASARVAAPVRANAKVTVTGTDTDHLPVIDRSEESVKPVPVEPKVMTDLDKKREIMRLINKGGNRVKTKAQYEKAVFEKTGLLLEPTNFDEIIKLLTSDDNGSGN